MTDAERKARLRQLAAERGQATAEAVDAVLIRLVLVACREPGGREATLAEVVERVAAAFPETERVKVFARFDSDAPSREGM